jgi:hypothetical protein
MKHKPSPMNSSALVERLMSKRQKKSGLSDRDNTEAFLTAGMPEREFGKETYPDHDGSEHEIEMKDQEEIMHEEPKVMSRKKIMQQLMDKMHKKHLGA